jgi:hypothetical protein
MLSGRFLLGEEKPRSTFRIPNASDRESSGMKPHVPEKEADCKLRKIAGDSNLLKCPLVPQPPLEF